MDTADMSGDDAPADTAPDSIPDGAPDMIPDTAGDGDEPDTAGAWPAANAWSWDGSWEPTDFPLDGLLDNEYFDGHPDNHGNPTPVLPPGEWDWNDGDNDLANWRNFDANLGHFDMLEDGGGNHYGWRLAANEPGACDYSGPAAYFEGSSGTDIMDLGAEGSIHSFTSGNLSEGPDVLVFRESWSLDFRTGSSETGGERDNDLVVAGCGENTDGSFDFMTTTIHTGPGRDWVFCRDISRAAVDLGNGGGGRTDTTDPQDGDDLLVLRGNTHDFRVFGGAGNDTAVWYLDDNVQTTTWLGPNFFGGGGDGGALWGDDGADRLVLALDASTPLVTETPTPPGSVMVRGTDGGLIPDEPTQHDPFARYCIECGTSPTGRRTVIMQYVSSDESIDTGYFFVTAFEVLQIGLGEGAQVYSIDDTTGTVSLLTEADPYSPPPWPDEYCP
ncbi:MAG: hypothetical protein ABIJ56_19920 [Pseudomonadota bacterium]